MIKSSIKFSDIILLDNARMMSAKNQPLRNFKIRGNLQLLRKKTHSKTAFL